MKKNKLLMGLALSAIVALPANIKAFTVNPAGFCNDNPANGTQNAICYIGQSRHITFITQNGDTSKNYFCLSKDKQLGAPGNYTDTAVKTYEDTGYACAVHNLLNDGTISVSDLTNGDFSFGTVTPDNTTNFTVQNVSGSALTYTKIQYEMWDIGSTATCNKYTDAKTRSIKLAASKPTQNGDYYVSKITVTKTNVDSYNVTLQNQPQGTIISTNNTAAGQVNGTNLTAGEFYILVPSASAASSIVTVKASREYTNTSVSAKVYEFTPISQSENQNLGKLNINIKTEPQTVSSEVKVSVDDIVDFKICKKDSKTNNPMSGVKFNVKSSDASTTFDLTTGTDGCATKANVKKAKYVVTEVTTPTGYVKINPKSVDCTTIASGTSCVYNAVNTPITLKVKKLDDSNEPLKDAKMQILDKDGNVFDEWTSVLEDHIVNKNIPFGKYKLREQEAPAGYVIATEIDFEIKEDGYVVGNETKPYTEDAVVTVTMVDKVTKVSILKTNAETGEPLVGAVLRIEKEDGTVVQEEWTTDGTPKVFTKMPVGTYYLVEVQAPDGYILQEERQPFTISQSSPDPEVIIENHKVPSTAANKSALLISFAMLDIALGIAIILYVRKRKISE